MRYAFPLVLLALAGCDMQSIADNAARPYQGKPVSLVFRKWGTPDSAVRGEGGTIYRWRVRDSGGSCRLEAHAGDSLAGGPQAFIGAHWAGDNATCASWMRMLN